MQAPALPPAAWAAPTLALGRSAKSVCTACSLCPAAQTCSYALPCSDVHHRMVHGSTPVPPPPPTPPTIHPPQVNHGIEIHENLIEWSRYVSTWAVCVHFLRVCTRQMSFRVLLWPSLGTLKLCCANPMVHTLPPLQGPDRAVQGAASDPDRGHQARVLRTSILGWQRFSPRRLRPEV